MHLFRGIASDVDITIPQVHSITGMPHAPVRAAQPTWLASEKWAIYIYTRDRLPCKKMTHVAGNTCLRVASGEWKPYQPYSAYCPAKLVETT